MGLADELQQCILASVVKCESTIVSSDPCGDKKYIVLDSPRRRAAHPTVPFQRNQHLGQMATEQFYQVNTSRVDTRMMLFEHVQGKSSIRHIEIIIPVDKIILRWNIDNWKEKFGDLEVDLAEALPATFPSLRTVMVRLDLANDSPELLLAQLPSTHPMFTRKVAGRMFETVTMLLEAVKRMDHVDSIGQIQKHVELRLVASFRRPVEIDGPEKSAEDLYWEMMGLVNAVARV